MLYPIEGVGDVGVVTDKPGHELPPGAWTAARNVRFIDGTVKRMIGEQPAHGGLIEDALDFFQFWNPSSNGSWLVAGKTKIYSAVGQTLTNLTRQTLGVDVDYAATADVGWSGGPLGNAYVLNNPNDLPQMWFLDTGTRMANLTAWPATYKAGVMRPFRNFLVAGDITKGSTRYPNLLKWSHPADPGSVPASWDETDETKDAGEYTLSESNGAIVDIRVLKDLLIIYMENSVWSMQFVGGTFVFQFRKLFSGFGCPVANCTIEYQEGRHFVFSGDDLLIHDGVTVKSILRGRAKSLLQDVKPGRIGLSFVMMNAVREEVWFCYADYLAATETVNKAIVWNWATNAISVRNLPDVTAGNCGNLDKNAILYLPDWDTLSGEEWQANYLQWSQGEGLEIGQRAILGCTFPGRAVSPLILVCDTWLSEVVFADPDEYRYEALIERTGIGLPVSAKAPPDTSSRKLLRGVWPRITGTYNRELSIQLGSQQFVGEEVVWDSPRPFKIGVDTKVNCLLSGRLFALRIRSAGDTYWELHGYDLDFVPQGVF